MALRFLLINPFYPISETPSPPLGISYLAAALEAAGIEVDVFDCVVFPYTREKLEEKMAAFSPHVIGATAVTMTVDHALSVVADAKAINSNIMTVIGGPHVTFIAKQTLQENSFLDVVVLGEGEETLPELGQVILGKISLNDVKGIVFRDKKELITTTFRPPISDLNFLPQPQRKHIPLGRYRALGMPISLTTSRGCPFKCIFCVGRKMVGAKVRYRDPIQVVDEMEMLNTLNFHQINIADDLFTSNRGHCLAVCQEILRRELDFQWTSFARVDTVSLDILAEMKKAGCKDISFGVETASPQILKTIKKGITLDQVVEAVKMCLKVGINPHASFILGLPGETHETIEETFEFCKKLKALGCMYGFHILAPFPGTLVQERPNDFGLRILSRKWSDYHANRAVCETPDVTKKEIDDIVSEFELKYDEYLGIIKDKIKDNTASEAEIFELQNLENIVIVYDLMMASILEDKLDWIDKSTQVSNIEALTDKVSPFVSHPRLKIEKALKKAYDNGNLTMITQNNKVKWVWKDYLVK